MKQRGPVLNWHNHCMHVLSWHNHFMHLLSWLKLSSGGRGAAPRAGAAAGIIGDRETSTLKAATILDWPRWNKRALRFLMACTRMSLDTSLEAADSTTASTRGCSNLKFSTTTCHNHTAAAVPQPGGYTAVVGLPLPLESLGRPLEFRRRLAVARGRPTGGCQSSAGRCSRVEHHTCTY